MNRVYNVLIIYFFSGKIIYEIMSEMELPGYSYIILGAVLSAITIAISNWLQKKYTEDVMKILETIEKEMN